MHRTPHYGEGISVSDGGKKRINKVIRGGALYPWLLFLIFLLLVIYFASYVIKFQDAHDRFIHSSSVSTICDARLKTIGIDFEGDLRLSLPRYTIVRRQLYASMAASLSAQGLTLGGTITQGLSQADLFSTIKDERAATTRVVAKLRPLDVPVRAVVMPVTDPVISSSIRLAVERVLLPLLPLGGIWLQDDAVYHSTIFHASSHSVPVTATEEEVQREVAAVRAVAGTVCPIRAVLERVIATPTGVIVACWQALPSSTSGEPAALRSFLAGALPRAPEASGQMVKEPAILHTTVARLLDSPVGTAPTAISIEAAMQNITSALCGITTVFRQVWFVEELDLLALALKGRYTAYPAPLSCSNNTLTT